MYTAAASEAAPFNTWSHVNNTLCDALFCLSTSVPCFSLYYFASSVFKQLQVAYWTTPKAGFDTELCLITEGFSCVEVISIFSVMDTRLGATGPLSAASCSSDLQD